jgi:P22 coat protein - gene protein 5
MANTILTPTMVTREAARLFYNNLHAAKSVNRQYDDKFMLGGAKMGVTINMRLPARYTVSSGATLQTQDQVETSRPLSLDQQDHVDVTFSSVELTLQLQDFSDRVLAPAMAQLANQVDVRVLNTMRLNTANLVGTPGTTPNALLTYAQAGAFLTQEGTPHDRMRYLILEPIAMATIVDALKGLFQQSEEIGQQYMQGMMGRALGFNWGEDANVPNHTVGPLGGTPLVNGANQGLLTGWAPFTDLLVKGWTAAAAPRLNQGDIITIAGVAPVNPLSRTQVSGRPLRHFVVSSTTEGTFSSDASGNGTLRIRPALIAGGQFQNVTARPADSAPITVVGTAGTVGARNFACHRDAYVLGCADLEMPDGVDWKARVAIPELGFSLRAVRQYTISNDSFPCRFDLLYGTAALLPEMSCVIAG